MHRNSVKYTPMILMGLMLLAYIYMCIISECLKADSEEELDMSGGAI